MTSKYSQSIPFTQLWYHSLQKQNKENIFKQPKQKIRYQSDGLKSKSKQRQCSKQNIHNQSQTNNDKKNYNTRSMMTLQQDVTTKYNPKNKRSSISYLPNTKIEKRSQVRNNSNHNISLILQAIRDNKDNFRAYSSQCCTMPIQNQKQNNISNNDKQAQQMHTQTKTKSIDQVTQKILQVIQNNVVPFLVDKFIESDEKNNKKILVLEHTIQAQQQQINLLISSNKLLENDMQILMKGILIKQGNTNSIFSLTGQQSQQINELKSKTGIVQIHEPKVSAPINLKTEQLYQKIKDQGTKINSIQETVMAIKQKHNESQQKIEQQFANKVYELIVTYNDNFVDLDHRICGLESLCGRPGSNKNQKKQWIKLVKAEQKAQPKKHS